MNNKISALISRYEKELKELEEMSVYYACKEDLDALNRTNQSKYLLGKFLDDLKSL